MREERNIGCKAMKETKKGFNVRKEKKGSMEGGIEEGSIKLKYLMVSRVKVCCEQ